MRPRLYPACLLWIALLAGCGDTTASSTDGSTAATETESTMAISVPTIPSDCPAVTDDPVTDASFPAGKPDVEIPAELPTELVITDLIEGTGDVAKAGDVVTVNYVGVRSEDGTEFDNSFDRGDTFPVTLGQGSVIAGWEQGLIGIQAGGRRQLDIPTELAYGDNPQGEIIQPGDALTFVIEAVSVDSPPPIADSADAPVVDIPESVGAAVVTVTDLVDGDRCLIALPGQTAYVQVILYRGDTGEEIQSSWNNGKAIDIPLNDSTIPGLVEGMVGMGVGGRRMLILPPAMGFGPEINTQMGLAADTDVILVIDLVQLD